MTIREIPEFSVIMNASYFKDLKTMHEITDRYVMLKTVHAFPIYNKRSYKKRPIKFFNHKKQQPIEIFKIRIDF